MSLPSLRRDPTTNRGLPGVEAETRRWESHFDLNVEALASQPTLSIFHRDPDGVLAGTVTEVGRAGLLDEPTPKLVMYWPGHDPDETAARAARLHVPGTEPTLDHELPWVTLVPAGVSKASGLARVAARLGVDRSEVLAVGDGDNDRAMLRWAGRGIAMGQAPPQVHADADESTGTVAEDGLARALERAFG